MRALLSTQNEKQISTNLVDWPVPTTDTNQVLIQAEFSSLNYKDALGVTGQSPIFKTFPIIGGIDVAGTVVHTKSPKFKVGDKVLITGCGLGESFNGGYSEFVLCEDRHVVLRPNNLSAREAMTYGTAGFTAALCIERMLQNGQTIDMGPILVTGATGGVGQFAVSFFKQLGFTVHALTHKKEHATRLKEIGADQIIFPSELALGSRPLEKVRYGGIVDNIGGPTLSQLIAHTQLWGNVCAVGLASGHELNTTVMPFILRGVSLLGISSNNTRWDLRLKIWDRLSTDLSPSNLDSFVAKTISLNEVTDYARKMLNRETHRRILVQI